MSARQVSLAAAATALLLLTLMLLLEGKLLINN